jgi:hypothetical protein
MSLTPLSGFLTPVSRQPFARRSSVDVFVRHTQGCPHRSSGRDFRKCRCPKYLYIYKDGQPSRLSAKTASWPEAEKKAQEVRNSWIPELAELKRLRAEKEMGRIGIEEAVDLYIADMRTRNQAKLTVANARSLFKSQQNSLSLISWVSKYNSDKEEMLRLMWLDQLDGTVLSRWRSEWVGAPLTLRNRWSRVVSFFNWFFRTGKIQKHPCVGLRNFSAHEGTTTPFTGVQFEHLLASASGVSVSQIVPSDDATDLDIFLCGSCKSIIRAPSGAIAGSGILNVGPKRALKREARLCVSSRCCFWSSPTGTWSAW